MNLSPVLEKKLYIGMEFRQFSRNNKFVKAPGKLSHINLNVSLFSNPGDNTRFCVKVQDRFVHQFLNISGPCPLDWRTTGLWNVFLTVFQAPWHACCSWKTVGTPFQSVSVIQSKVMVGAAISCSQDKRVWHIHIYIYIWGFARLRLNMSLKTMQLSPPKLSTFWKKRILLFCYIIHRIASSYKMFYQKKFGSFPELSLQFCFLPLLCATLTRSLNTNLHWSLFTKL